jgi:hypothetical protein
MHGGELFAAVIFLAVFLAVGAAAGVVLLLVKLVELFNRRLDRRSWILPRRR